VDFLVHVPSPGLCCRKNDDVGFARDISAFISASCYPNGATLKTESVFSVGFSNGAMMSNRLACEATDLYAAIGPQAGNIISSPLSDFPSCEPSRPIGYLAFCGTRDSACILGFADNTRVWLGHNNCTGGAPEVTVSTATTTCTRYGQCNGGVYVEQCLIDGLGHEWSGHPRPYQEYTRPDSDIDSTGYIFDVFGGYL
jgi:polyhydroxybutyrate depolymerase